MEHIRSQGRGRNSAGKVSAVGVDCALDVSGDRMEVKVSMKRDIRKRRAKGIDLVMKRKTLWQAEGLNAT